MTQATGLDNLLTQQAEALIEEVRSQHPDVVQLAKIISLAARVEPELLRKARLALLPEAEAGIEADLWFSPLIQSENVLGLVLLPDVKDALLRELSNEPQLLKSAWDVLCEVHENAPPVTRLEEEIIWLALSKSQDASELIERCLEKVITAIVNENRRGLVQWAAHTLPRLPEAARKTQAAWILAIAVGARLDGQQVLEEQPPDNAIGKWLPWILPEDIQRVPVGVRLFEGMVEFGDPAMPGARTIELPKTNPLLLEVSWQEDTNQYVEQVIWSPGSVQTVQIGPGTITIRTGLGDIYRLSPENKRVEALLSAVDSEVQAKGYLSPGKYFLGQKQELPDLERWLKEEIPLLSTLLTVQQELPDLVPWLNVKEVDIPRPDTSRVYRTLLTSLMQIRSDETTSFPITSLLYYSQKVQLLGHRQASFSIIMPIVPVGLKTRPSLVGFPSFSGKLDEISNSSLQQRISGNLKFRPKSP